MVQLHIYSLVFKNRHNFKETYYLVFNKETFKKVPVVQKGTCLSLKIEFIMQKGVWLIEKT